MTRVFLATPMYGGMVTGSYAISLMQTPLVLVKNGIGLHFNYKMGSSMVTTVRNELVRDFLSSDATHLMWIDADIGFDPQDIVTMVAADKDMICGLYPGKAINWEQVADAVRNDVPIEQLSAYSGTAVAVSDGVAPSTDEPFEVTSAGMGFMLVQRRVYEVLADHVPEGDFYTPAAGSGLSDDYHFCRLVREHGMTIHAAPWVRLTHTGTYAYECPKGQTLGPPMTARPVVERGSHLNKQETDYPLNVGSEPEGAP